MSDNPIIKILQKKWFVDINKTYSSDFFSNIYNFLSCWPLNIFLRVLIVVHQMVIIRYIGYS